MMTTSPTHAPSARPEEAASTPRESVQRDPAFARTIERLKARMSDDQEEETPGAPSASFSNASRDETPPGAAASGQLQPIAAKAPAVQTAPQPAGAVPDHAWVNAVEAQNNALVLRLPGQDSALRAITLSRTAAGLDMKLTAHRLAAQRLSVSMEGLKEKLRARGVELDRVVVRAEEEDEES